MMDKLQRIIRIPEKRKPQTMTAYGGNIRVKLGTIEGWRMSFEDDYKLLVDFTLRPWGSDSDLKHDTREQLTTRPLNEIIRMGYRESEGYKSKLAFYRIPVYVKFNNFKKCEGYQNGWVDRMGVPCPPGTPNAHP